MDPLEKAFAAIWAFAALVGLATLVGVAVAVWLVMRHFGVV